MTEGRPGALLAGYLDCYRDAVLRKLDGIDPREASIARLPSGWTPAQLLKHLTFMERRWLEWGFAGVPVPDPYGDDGPDGAWRVDEGETMDVLVERFRHRCARSRELVAGAELGAVAAIGGRFEAGSETPTLGWILFHVLQEYARHLGHLDVVRELADGTIGE